MYLHLRMTVDSVFSVMHDSIQMSLRNDLHITFEVKRALHAFGNCHLKGDEYRATVSAAEQCEIIITPTDGHIYYLRNV